MKTIGIVAEYNPLHNGHLYHLQASRQQSGADCVVVVMSGSYTQRGEPAIVDKWARAEMALYLGADLVIELPVAYAMSSAEYFAYGAIKLLDSLGAVDMLYFGSEAGSLEILSKVAHILADEPESYKAQLKESLSKGISFPAARQKAIISYFKSKYENNQLSSLLKSPNNILAIEYLKALLRLKSSIIPKTIERVGNDYNSSNLSGRISSATAIRKIISCRPWNNAREFIKQAIPPWSMDILERELELGRGLIFPENFEMPLISTLRRMQPTELKQLPYMEEGLENRISLASKKSGSYHELLDLISTKRYTDTRIRRILSSALIGLTKEIFNNFNSLGGPAYIRILGINSTGRKLLSTINKNTSLPVITKTADYKNSILPGVAAMLELEAAATDQYALGCPNPYFRQGGSDFTRNVVLKESF